MSIKQKLLIVEDEALIAMSFEIALSMNGYSCRVVASGEDALAAVADQAPDTVILDIHLAGQMNGVHCGRTIREKYDVPIIFMTGYNVEEIRDQTSDLKNVYYLEKPIPMPKLLRIIKQVNPVS